MRKPCTKCEYAWKTTKCNIIVGYPTYDLRCKNCEEYKRYCKYKESQCAYKVGETIKTIQDFEEHLPDGFMYWCDHIKHVSILEHMQYHTLKSALKAGIIHTAIKKEEIIGGRQNDDL